MTAQALRVRVTQHGLDLLSQGLQDVLKGMCSGTGPNAPCGLDDPTNPTLARFYVGGPNSPVDFSALGINVHLRTGEVYAVDGHGGGGARPYCDDTGGVACTTMLARGLGSDPAGEGFCRDPDTTPVCTDPAHDYCCGKAPVCTLGAAPTSCTAPRSSISLDLANLDKGMKLELLPADTVGGGGIRITLGGCSPTACPIKLHTDLTAVISAGGFNMACNYHDSNPAAGTAAITSLQVTLRPKIAIGSDGRSRLVFDSNDAVSGPVGSIDISMPDMAATGVPSDPVCYSGGSCGSCFGLPGSILDWMTQGLVASTLATALTNLVGGQTAGGPLDTAMALPLDALPGKASRAQPIGLLMTGNMSSPSYSGLSGVVGINVDLDFAMMGNHSNCAPTIHPPIGWSDLQAPSPGPTVLAPDATGTLQAMPYSAAIMLGDTVLRRAFYVLYDSGALCLNFDAASISALTGGAFVPTLGSLALFSSRVVELGESNTPVSFELRPSEPPVVRFGTGAGSGATRDSHVQVTWSGVRLDMVPWVDEAPARAFGFTFDLAVNASVEPRADGALYLMFDKLALDNLAQDYNELGITFDLKGVSDLLAVFVPLIVDGKPLRFDLSTASLGSPVVPKVRSVDLAGFLGNYLAAFLELCLPSQIADPANAFCYEAPTKSGGTGSAQRFDVAAIASAGTPSVILRPHGPSSPGLQLAYRVDAMGPLYAFRGSHEGAFVVEHPALAWAGAHEIELVVRDAARPRQWQSAGSVRVTIDRAAPHVRVARTLEGVLVSVWDDATPPDAAEIRAHIEGPRGARELAWSPGAFVPLAAEESAVVWARDAVLHESLPAQVRALSTPTPALAPAGSEARGCASLGGGDGLWAALSLALGLFAWRRRFA